MKWFSPSRKYEPYFYLPARERMSDPEYEAMKIRSFFAVYDARCATIWSDHQAYEITANKANEALAAGIVFG